MSRRLAFLLTVASALTACSERRAPSSTSAERTGGVGETGGNSAEGHGGGSSGTGDFSAATGFGAGAGTGFIWCNDDEWDTHSGTLAAALAKTGALEVIGAIRSQNSVAGCTYPEIYLQAGMVQPAWSDGWSSLPGAVDDLGADCATPLQRPETGTAGCADDNCLVDYTTRQDPNAATKAMYQAVMKYPGSVIIGTGGPLTTVANAYLHSVDLGTAATFAKKVTVYAAVGFASDLNNLGYNAGQDPWALSICLMRLGVIMLPYFVPHWDVASATALIDTLSSKHPSSKIVARMMYNRDHIIADLGPDGYDPDNIGDPQPIMYAAYGSSYVGSYQAIKFDHWNGLAPVLAWGGDNDFYVTNYNDFIEAAVWSAYLTALGSE